MQKKKSKKTHSFQRSENESLPTHNKLEGVVRIVGGLFKRTPLKVADREGLRPTPERLRETAFDWFNHLLGGVEGHRFCDMFAGSGALGFEAASRGAAKVLSIDLDRKLTQSIRETVEKLRCSDRMEVVTGDALTVLEKREDMFDVIFIDPPYALHLQKNAVKVALPHLNPEGILYIESDEPFGEGFFESLSLQVLREVKIGKVFCVLARALIPFKI